MPTAELQQLQPRQRAIGRVPSPCQSSTLFQCVVSTSQRSTGYGSCCVLSGVVAATWAVRPTLS